VPKELKSVWQLDFI
jgi:hypothetical protein